MMTWEAFLISLSGMREVARQTTASVREVRSMLVAGTDWAAW